MGEMAVVGPSTELLDPIARTIQGLLTQEAERERRG